MVFVSRFLLLGGACLCAAGPLFPADPATSAAWERFRIQSSNTMRGLALVASTAGDRADDAVELTFAQFFEPIGDEGLRFTPGLQALAGRRVRLTGYMVREAARSPGGFLLAPRPSALAADAPCVDADLPPSAVHVHAPGVGPVPFVPGPLVVVGTLELGAQTEANGRNSWVRLRLDARPFAAPEKRPSP